MKTTALLALALAGAGLVAGSYRAAHRRLHSAPPARPPAAPTAVRPQPPPPGQYGGYWWVQGYNGPAGYVAVYAGPFGWYSGPLVVNKPCDCPPGSSLWGPYASGEGAWQDANRCSADKTGATKPNPPGR